jgi:endoglucanase
MKKFYIIILLIIPIVLLAQVETPFIVVDQFGYRPEAPKTAFIRNPQTGYDAGESFTPGNIYALVETSTQEQVFTGTPQVWNNGLEDETSGDIVWRFDFSEFKAEGEFYVLDIENNVKSYNFNIQSDIYRDVLIQAFKTFFYQRLGFAKETPYAGIGWADGASHLGELQDTQCREWGGSRRCFY